MVRIRLSRFGRRNRPFYRIEVFDSRVRRDGRSLEQLGWYDPMVADEEKKYSLDKERALYWLLQGAQPSGTASDILRKLGVEKEFREQRKQAAKS